MYKFTQKLVAAEVATLLYAPPTSTLGLNILYSCDYYQLDMMKIMII